MSEKKCRHCAMMIPKEAKYCPYCQKTQGTHWFVMLLAILIAFFALTFVISIMQTQKQQSVSQQIQLTAKGQKVKKAHPSWSNEACNLIGDKKFQIGMTKEMVIAAWRKPERINRTVTLNREHEQWVYGDNTYLYFDEGILTSWQD